MIGKKAGKAKITAVFNGKKKTIIFTVAQKKFRTNAGSAENKSYRIYVQSIYTKNLYPDQIFKYITKNYHKSQTEISYDFK